MIVTSCFALIDRPKKTREAFTSAALVILALGNANQGINGHK